MPPSVVKSPISKRLWYKNPFRYKIKRPCASVKRTAALGENCEVGGLRQLKSFVAAAGSLSVFLLWDRRVKRWPRSSVAAWRPCVALFLLRS